MADGVVILSLCYSELLRSKSAFLQINYHCIHIIAEDIDEKLAGGRL